MKLGAASWGFRETPLAEQLAITKKLNMETLELGIAGHERDFLQIDSSYAQIAEVKALFEKYGLYLICASTGNDFTQAEKEANYESLETVKKASELASQIGVKFLRIFAGFSPVTVVTGKRRDLLVECLNVAVEYADGFGITLAIETHGGVEAVTGGVRHFHSSSTVPESLLSLMKELDPRAGLVFDPANLGAVGMSETEILNLYQKVKDRICYFHLKDFKKYCPPGSNTTVLVPCACGEGQLDWAKLWAEFSSFNCPGLIEYEIPDDIEDGLYRSLKVLSIG